MVVPTVAFNWFRFTASVPAVPLATLVMRLPPILMVLPFLTVKLPRLVLPFTVKLPVVVTLLNSTSSLVEMLSVSPAP